MSKITIGIVALPGASTVFLRMLPFAAMVARRREVTITK
jgi:branched-subunit amino acid transport protein AzlD